jgi:hypothetical protein
VGADQLACRFTERPANQIVIILLAVILCAIFFCSFKKKIFEQLGICRLSVRIKKPASMLARQTHVKEILRHVLAR